MSQVYRTTQPSAAIDGLTRPEDMTKGLRDG